MWQKKNIVKWIKIRATMYKAEYKAILLSADLAREQYTGLTTHDSIHNSVEGCW